jgi:dTDP-4-amino-4,6-dideoxygalactose transaminase
VAANLNTTTDSVPLFKVHMPPKTALLPALEQTLYSGYVGQGPKVTEFEAALAGLLGTPHVVTVNSGTSAIQLALRLAGVRGGSVVTTPMTCAATAMPILAEGARIIWADIGPGTGNIDPVDAEFKIEPDTRAILAVNWGGQPCDMDQLGYVARMHGIPLIVDAAHALGAMWDSQPVGGPAADYTCFSLQAIKHITTVDGGILTTRDPDAYERGKLLRWYGIDRETERRDARIEGDIAEWGYKFHMNDVAATIGLAQLPYLGGILTAQRANAAFYDTVLDGYTGRQPVLPQAEGAWWLYTLLLNGRREAFREWMTGRGIQVSQVHARLDRHTCFRDFDSGPLPGVDEFYDRMCCIPVHWALTEADRMRVADAVIDFCEAVP